MGEGVFGFLTGGRSRDDGTFGNQFEAIESILKAVGWTPLQIADVAANSSDKTLVVPAGKEWMLQSIQAELITTALAGIRQMTVYVRDDMANTLFEAIAGATQIESLTRNYHFAAGTSDMITFRDTKHLSTPLPPLVLLPGYDVRIRDNKAIAAAADDMVVRMLVMERDV